MTTITNVRISDNVRVNIHNGSDLVTVFIRDPITGEFTSSVYMTKDEIRVLSKVV